jgi:hypothetical protein
LTLLSHLGRFGWEVKDMKSSTEGISRRDFLKALGITTGLMMIPPIVMSLGSVVSEILSDRENFWKKYFYRCKDETSRNDFGF